MSFHFQCFFFSTLCGLDDLPCYIYPIHQPIDPLIFYTRRPRTLIFLSAPRSWHTYTTPSVTSRREILNNSEPCFAPSSPLSPRRGFLFSFLLAPSFVGFLSSTNFPRIMAFNTVWLEAPPLKVLPRSFHAAKFRKYILSAVLLPVGLGRRLK